MNEHKFSDHQELLRISHLVDLQKAMIHGLTSQQDKTPADDLLAARSPDRQYPETAPQYLDLMRISNAQKVAQDQLDALYAPVHPIRRCPTDVLQYIFEWAVDMKTNSAIPHGWFRNVSTNLSHVCHRWRKLALQTPHLWDRFWISVGYNTRHVEFMWGITVERVRSFPVIIDFWDGSRPKAATRALSKMNFNEIPQIREFNLHLMMLGGLSVVRNFGPSVLPNRIESLSIILSEFWGGIKEEVEDDDIIFEATPGIDFLSIVQNFTPSKRLHAERLDLATIVPGPIFPDISDLLIYKSRRISLLVLKAFPNVKTAFLWEVSFPFQGDDIVKWPELHTLTGRDLPWEKFNVPHLTTLNTGTNLRSPSAFISSHPSIRHLDLGSAPDLIASLPECAPQLLTLSVGPSEELCTILSLRPGLDQLTELLIHQARYEQEDGQVTLEFFEKIVRSRFLPGIHRPDSGQSPTLVSSLSILSPRPKKTELEDWRKSELLLSAKEEVSIVSRRGHYWRRYKLCWLSP